MNILEFYKDNIQINKSNELTILLILSIFAAGVMLLFIPVHLLLLFVLTVGLMVFFTLKPEYCYYSLVFTIPFTERLRILPISFSINDVLILVCGITTFLSIFLKSEKIDFKTSLDKWMLILLALYFLAGTTSINNTGILSSFKFLEAVITFYLTIYFIRSKRVTISKILKILLFTALFQATLGILQSLTGSFGAWFQSQRGYLGYLGIGSKTVWHGFGTMGHFNMLGNFLTIMLLFFLPVYHYLVKRKTAGKIIISILLLGLLTTYSRGSLLGLIAGFLFFIFNMKKNSLKNKILIPITVISLILFIMIFSNSEYVYTVDFTGRQEIWKYPLTAIMSSFRSLWFGSGLNSYWETIAPYLPVNIPSSQYKFWFAHNYFILAVQEMGIIGALILFSFLINLFKDNYKKFKSSRRFSKALYLAGSLCILSIFFISMFDHAFSLPFFKILLFIIFGILYARNSRHIISAKTD